VESAPASPRPAPGGSSDGPRAAPIDGLLLFVLVSAGYVAGYKLAQHWFSAEDQGASFFPAAGVTLAALVLLPRRRWWIVLAAAASSELALDVAAGTSVLASLGYAFANTAQPLVGALLLTSLVASVDLRRTRDLGAFVGSSVLFAPAVGGVVAATVFVTIDDRSGWARFAFEWWSGDGLGVLVVGGALLSLRARPHLPARRVLEGCALAGVAVGATVLVFELGWFEFVYLPAALLVVLAFRVGTTGVALTSAAVALAAAGATAEAQDFWSSIDVSPANRILYLQLALAVVIAAVLALAAEISERERIAVQLARTEAERAAAEERAQLFDAERAARERAELLEGHAARLTAARNAEEVARATLAGLEEIGVTAAWVQLLHDGTLSLVGTFGVPEENLRRYARYGLPSSTPPAEAAATGRMVVVSTGEELDARYADAAVGRRRLPYESLVSVPLQAADGGTLGVLTFTSREPHWLDEPRRLLVVALAEQCGLALERALLQQKARAAAADIALLAQLGEVLVRPTGAHERARALVDTLTRSRAALAVVHVLDEDGRPQVLEEASTRAESPELAGEVARLASEAARTEADALVVAEAAGIRLLAHPLRARNQTLGVLTVGLDGQRPGIGSDLLGRIAIRAALALDNALLYERERAVSQSLQLGLLGGDPASTPWTAIATAYQPGTAALEVGGDWYDAFALPDGRLALLVGDVVGHGLEAAVAMGQLRGAVRALAPTGSPAEILAGLDQFANTVPEASMATIAYVELDARDGRVAYACAGHPPPLLVPAEGAPRLLWDGRSEPLGSSFSRGREEATARLRLGDTIVLYTDGLVERRTEAVSVGLDRLVEIAGGAPRAAPADLVARLLDVLLTEGPTDDDVCVLVLRLVGSERRFAYSFLAAPSEVAHMRGALARWLETVEPDVQTRRDAVLAVSEAAANAAEHAYGFDASGVVSVEAEVADGTLQFAVRDAGSWRTPDARTDRGRGHVLMRALMEEVVVDPGPDGTVVRMRLPVASRQASR